MVGVLIFVDGIVVGVVVVFVVFVWVVFVCVVEEVVDWCVV